MAGEPSKLRKGVVDSDEDAAEGLRGFGISSIVFILFILLTGNIVLSNMVVLPVGFMIVLIWRYFSHTPWKEIGYVWPKHWIFAVVGGMVAGIILKILLKSLILPLLGAAPINQTYHFLTGNRAVLPMAILAMLIAGFAEETVWRGFLFERLGKILGSGTKAKAFTVIITSFIFSLSHYGDQGIVGAMQAIFTGLTFGTIYAASGRLVFVMAAHAGYDLLSLAMIYTGTESDFAHFVFG